MYKSIGRMGAAAVVAAGCFGCGRAKPQVADLQAAARVRVAMPERREFQDAARVQGTVQAKVYAEVAARQAGPLDAFWVDEGDAVTAGQPLFQTDRVELERQLEINQRNLDVAAAMQLEAAAVVEEARAGHTKAEADYKRFRELLAAAAVTQDAFERAELAFKQTEAVLARAEAGLTVSRMRRAQAESNLAIAQKRLDDSLVRAPFDGVVAVRHSEPGEFASLGKAVLRMEDVTRLEVSALLSETLYDRVHAGKSVVTVRLRDTPVAEGVVTYKAATVDPVSRTFEIKADLPRTELLAPGMLCGLDVVLMSRSGLGVPTTAVSIRRGAPCVFVLRDGKAALTPVKTGIAANGQTELLQAEALSGLPVIVEGQAFLNDGDPVETRE